MKFLAVCCGLLLSASVFALEVGDTAPDISVEDYVNGIMTKESLLKRDASQKYILVEFFTSWCPSCAQNFPIVGQLSQRIKTTAATRIVSVDHNESEFQNYLNEHQTELTFPAAFDRGFVAGKAYGIEYIPTNFVVDANNRIIFKKVGVLTDQEQQAISLMVSQ